jgi:L-cystine uptake protein TcyP (sodium:dicarboxylate symporter family)
MKLYEPFTAIVIGVVIFSALLGIATYKWGDMKQDNIIEELAEDVIESQTGIELDLSPDTMELAMEWYEESSEEDVHEFLV